MTSGNGIDPKFFNEVSQFAHFGMAATIYFTFGTFLKPTGTPMLVLYIAGIVLAAVKEFWYDRHFEDTETRGSDLEDFSFYVVGIAWAAITFGLKGMI